MEGRVNAARYEVKTGDARLPVRLIRKGMHLYLVEVIGQGTTTWVMPSELVAVGSGTIEIGVAP
jgi:hypothetical protein